MKQISYTITDSFGIHARPAGQLVKAVSAFQCDTKIAGPTKEVDAKRIMGVMCLGVKQGDKITMTFSGADEAEAAAAMATFLRETL